MAKYDGLIIPRSYSEYINKTDSATLQQALQLSGVLDSVPTEDSVKAVKSGGVYNALAGKQPTLTFDDVPTDGSDNPVKSNGIYDALAGKQDTLTFDDVPTASSNNPVKSGGVKSAISNAIDYSESETLTGANWINGKPIYRRVIVKTLPNTSNTSYVLTNIGAIGNLVTGKFILKTGTFQAEGAIFTSTTYTPFNVGYVTNTGDVIYKNVVSNYFGQTIIAIVEYTKVT